MIFIIYVLRKRTDVYHLKFSMESKEKASIMSFMQFYGVGTILDKQKKKNYNKGNKSLKLQNWNTRTLK